MLMNATKTLYNLAQGHNTAISQENLHGSPLKMLPLKDIEDISIMNRFSYS